VLGAAALAVAVLAAGVLAVVAAGLLRRSGPAADPWLMAEKERRIEMRLVYAPVDRHRPPSARKARGEGSPAANPPQDVLAELERKGDAPGLAAAYLLRDDPGLADRALAALEPLPSTPEVETHRAAALLVKELPGEALRHLERALAGPPPGLPQALWNRALALKALELRRTAARDFEAVAALQEPGWSAEARTRAYALTSAEKSRRERWLAVVKAGEALASAGTPPSAMVLAGRPARLRLYFYDAVRTRTSREQVQALLPLARELDQQAGGEVLAGYVERIAARDFARRAPFAPRYAQLRKGALPPEQVQALVAELLRSGEDDLLLGALVHAKALDAKVMTANLAAFEARAQASGDPWFRLLAAQERAGARLARGEAREAQRTLEEALALCATAPIEHRCLSLELELAEVHARQKQLDEAWKHAEQGWRQARAANDRPQENLALERLGQLARLRGNVPLGRAFEEEYAERTRGASEAELLGEGAPGKSQADHR
jgi:tetratricopeptide (TPR) repeat protein